MKDKKEKKLVEVRLEFDDGTYQTLTGKDAEAWLEAVNSCCMMSGIHGFPMVDFKWKTCKRGKK